MNRSIFSSFLLGVLFLACAIAARGQEYSAKGRELWLGLMENRDVNEGSTFALVIVSDLNTSGMISIPMTGLTIPFTVRGNIAEQIILPRADFSAVGSERVEGKGMLITADDPVSVTAIHYKAYFSDASNVLPSARLGSEYVVIAGMDDTQFSPGEFLIVATEDETEIEITPSVVTLGLHPARLPFTVMLDRGETYQVQAMEDLSGTMVRSKRGERFALFSGARAAGVKCNDDSHLYDQLYPVGDLGLQYITLPFFGKGGDLVKITATEDGTIVTIDCARSIRLDRGEHYDTVAAEALSISATRPIAVAQFARGEFCSGFGGPTMLALLPVSFALKRGVFKSLYRYNALISGPHFTRHYLNILLRADAIANVRVNGAPLGASFRPVPGDRDYVYAQVTFGGDTGTQVITCDSGLIAYAYGFGDYDAYSYAVATETAASRGSDTLRFQFTLGGELGIAIRGCDTIIGSGTICTGGDVTFTADVDATFTDLLWTFGDGTGASGPTVTHRYTDTGVYRVRLSALDRDCGAYTITGVVNVGDCSSLRSAPRLVVVPNPTAGRLVIVYTIPKEGDVRVELFNAFGEFMGVIADGRHEAGRHEEVHDMGEYPAGGYLLRATFNGRMVTERVVKVE